MLSILASALRQAINTCSLYLTSSLSLRSLNYYSDQLDNMSNNRKPRKTRRPQRPVRTTASYFEKMINKTSADLQPDVLSLQVERKA